jgi:mxaJ protein
MLGSDLLRKIRRRLYGAAIGIVAVGALFLALRPPELAAGAHREVRVCADPNNLPFSNQKQEGFENKIAELLASDLGAALQYTWWPQRRGFFRNTLNAKACDVVIGVPSGLGMALTTKPYYRSSFVFVSRRDRGIGVQSFDDPALRQKTLRIGVQLVGDDYVNTPPAHALGRRGIVENVVGYTVYGDASREVPAAGIVDAVEAGEVDVAVVWGPLAGYFAKKKGRALDIRPVTPEKDGNLPLAFDISMGVRKGDKAWKQELEAFLERRRSEVLAILEEHGVPRR